MLLCELVFIPGGGGGDSVQGFFRRGKFRTCPQKSRGKLRTSQILSALEAKGKTKRVLQWLTQAQFHIGKIPYLPSKNEGKISHEVEIRDFPRGKFPPRNPPPAYEMHCFSVGLVRIGHKSSKSGVSMLPWVKWSAPFAGRMHESIRDADHSRSRRCVTTARRMLLHLHLHLHIPWKSGIAKWTALI